ncbi:MAG: type III secretion system export apparatus subunit SctU [Gammaproteobacteria bacterium]
MAKEKGASQTEKPTSKRLRDARRDGDVHKSKELTSTVLVLLWLLMGWLLAPVIGKRLRELFAQMFDVMSEPFGVAVYGLGLMSLQVFLYVMAILLLPAIIIGTFTDFLQIGAIFAPTKVKPNAAHLNPVEGLKRMFSMRNFVEVIKALAKTILLVGIIAFVLLRYLNDILGLPLLGVGPIGPLFWQGTVLICTAVIFVFFFVAVLDALYQRHAYTKDLMMSRRDIKQESKENEGDPMIKSHRKQLHQEWAQQNQLQAVRKSSVVVTNPTHIAVALFYDEQETELPVITAMGEGVDAQRIREVAEEEGIPIMENVKLARGLYADLAVDDYVTAPFFDAVAEVLQWAESMANQRYGK